MAAETKNKSMGIFLLILVALGLFGGMWFMNNKKLEEEKAKTAEANAGKEQAIAEAAKKKVTQSRFDEMVVEKIAAIKKNSEWIGNLTKVANKEGEKRTLEEILEETAIWVLGQDGFYVA